MMESMTRAEWMSRFGERSMARCRVRVQREERFELRCKASCRRRARPGVSGQGGEKTAAAPRMAVVCPSNFEAIEQVSGRVW